MTTIAGTGVAGSADNANPLLAQFSSPNGIAVDGAGNIYIADTGNSLIRLMDNTGAVSTFAGTTPGYANGAALTAAQFTSPRGVAVDQNTNVFVADTGSQTVRQISGGTVSLLAGLAFSTVPAGQDGIGAAARFANPWGIAYDGSASLFVGDSANNTIRKISLGGVVSTIGGAPPPAVAAYADGTGSTARFSSPRGIGVAPGGDLFLTDCNNHDIRKASFTVGSTKDKGVVVYYPNSGPVPGGAAKNGAVWLSRVLTNNVFGFGGNDRFQAGIINNENGTNYIYVTGAAENQVGTNQFFIAKGKTNGIGLWIGTDNYSFSATNTNSSFGMALASVNGTNIVVAGYTNGSLGLDRPYLVGFSTNGTEIYSRISTAAPVNVGRYYGVTAFNGFLYAVGTTDGGTNGDCLIEQWDLNGNFLQRQTYQLDSANNDSLYGIVGVGCSGHLYAVGTRTNGAAGASSDGILLEIDPTTLAGISTNIVDVVVGVTTNAFNSANAITTDGTDLYVAATTLTTTGNGRDMVLFRYRVKNWYLPEESLSQFIGESSFGEWKLEMWDSRDSNSVPAAALKCWDINFSYAPLGTPAAVLVAGVPVTRVTLANRPVFFVVPTPFGATHVTNTITATGKVSLVYNLTRTPVPGARGNVTIGTVTNGGKIVLGTGGTTPFKPGQRYYLALIAGEGTGSVTIQVDFDQSAPPIPTLTSGIFSSGTRASGVGMDYYQFNVPSGSAGVLFDLEPVNGNLDLYVRKANTNLAAGAQLTTGQYDYRSINFGTHGDQILVVPGTGVVPLTAGTWYLGVANADIRSVNYNIRATSFGGAPYGIVPLASAVPVFGATTPGNAPNTMFKLTVATATPSALFQVTSLSGNGDLILRRGNYPTVATNDFKSANSGTLAETVVIRTNSTLTNIGGDWYLGVVNNDPFDLTYTVTAHLPTNGLLISATPLAMPNSRPAPQYFTNKAFGLDVATLPGEKYQVQYKTNLSVTNWITLGTYVAPSNGTITFVHTNALTNRSIIYRIQQVP
ncbi:MAG: pre-peptidase C-terminal domain-containing protein [Verrucomicrobia bacterium]|nr:pre-peptidase C-terminal domain-containing protein [Verrucomicrobiota bacterium]